MTPPPSSPDRCPGCGLSLLGTTTAPVASGDEATQLPGGSDDSNPFPKIRFDAGAIRRFGKFELLDELGSGGMGTVYKARQSDPDRLIALKMVHSGPFAGEAFRRRFELEASAVANLRHPNCVTLYEAGEVDGTPFFTMSLVEGQTLAEAIDANRFSLREMIDILIKAAAAIHHAHQRGILHRDLKPSNILIDRDGEPFIADFGLAKIIGGQELTMPGAVLGTPAFMAPEQASGRIEAISTATDVYGLGAILYVMLTGRPPFTGKSAAKILEKVLSHDPPDPRSLNPVADPDLTTICLKSLEKDDSPRYSSAAEFRSELERWCDGEPILARPIGLVGRSIKWARRKPAIAALGAAVGIAVMVGIVAFGIQYRETVAAKDQYFAQVLRLLEDHAEDESTAGDAGVAVARWAHILTVDPDHRLARRRIADLLQNRNFARPIERRVVTSEESQIRHVRSRSGGRIFVSDDQGKIASIDFGSTNGDWSVHTETRIHDLASILDGAMVATAQEDGRVVFWNAETGKRETDLPHGHRVTSIVADRPGRQIVTASDDGTLRLWDCATRQATPLPILREGNTRIRCDRLLFSWDGRQIAARLSIPGDRRSGRKDRHLLQVWNCPTGESGATIEPEGVIGRVSFSPDGERLAVATMDPPHVRIWDTGTGTPSNSVFVHPQVITKIVLGPDGRFLATACVDGYARVWNIANGEIESEFRHTGIVEDLKFNEDGNQLLTVAKDHRVRLWDVRSGIAQSENLVHDHEVVGAGFLPAKGQLFTISASGEAVRWQIKESQPVIHHASRVLKIELSPDENELAAITLDTNVVVRSLKSGTQPFILPQTGPVSRASYDPTGNILVAYGLDSIVRVWKRGTDGRLHRYHDSRYHGAAVRSVAFTPDGKWALSGGFDARAFFWSTQTGILRTNDLQTGVFKHSGGVKTCDFSPDGHHFATGTRINKGSGKASLYSTTSRNRIHSMVHNGPVVKVKFSPDGKLLATASEDGFARVWNVASGSLHLPPLRHDNDVVDVRFSPDGRHLITASRDDTARIWRTEDGSLAAPPLRHREAVNGAFYLSESKVVTYSEDATAQVWDAVTGKPLIPWDRSNWTRRIQAWSGLFP